MILLASALAAASMLAGPAAAASTDGPGGTTSDGREWAVERPGRGAYSRTVALAALPPKRWRAFARCVEDRESGGSPTALNASSGAAGLHQWLPAWQRGLPYNVAARLRAYGMPAPVASGVREYLAGTPIRRWPAAYQRVGFADQLERPGGWAHWSLAGSRCDRLVPR